MTEETPNIDRAQIAALGKLFCERVKAKQQETPNDVLQRPDVLHKPELPKRVR
jgi:hypothetical protein